MLLFLGTYFVLTALYAIYLSSSVGGQFYPDFITHLVANQSSILLEGIGFDSYTEPDLKEPFVHLFMNGYHLTNIIEGCNGVSIVILFISFIIAFAQKLKKTFLFILAGTAIIYSMNIVRIAVLTIALLQYPSYNRPLHDIVFPGIIYGTVFILWMVWVRSVKASIKHEKSN